MQVEAVEKREKEKGNQYYLILRQIAVANYFDVIYETMQDIYTCVGIIFERFMLNNDNNNALASLIFK